MSGFFFFIGKSLNERYDRCYSEKDSSNQNDSEWKKINGREANYQALKVVSMKGTGKEEIIIEIGGHILKIFQST